MMYKSLHMGVPARPITLMKTLNNLSAKLLSSKVAWHGRRAGWDFSEGDQEAGTLSGRRSSYSCPQNIFETSTLESPWDPRRMFLSRNALKIRECILPQSKDSVALHCV